MGNLQEPDCKVFGATMKLSTRGSIDTMFGFQTVLFELYSPVHLLHRQRGETMSALYKMTRK